MRSAWVAAEHTAHARCIWRGNNKFFGCLSLACHCGSLLAPTIIIGGLKGAATDNDRKGPPKVTNIAVRDAMHYVGLNDLKAGVAGTPPYPTPLPPKAAIYPSRIDTCLGVSTTVRIHEADYGNLPTSGRGHRRLYIDLIIPNLPPPPATIPDAALPPPLKLSPDDDDRAWHKDKETLHAILRRPNALEFTAAMPQAAQACGMERNTAHTRASPDLIEQQLVDDIWTPKAELAAVQSHSTPDPQECDTHLRTFRLPGPRIARR